MLLFLYKGTGNMSQKSDLQKRDLAIRASLLYYEENLSQDDISKQLGVSRSYISQLLSYAKENHIVKIEITVDEYNLRNIRQEIEWGKKWTCLKQVYIMNSDSHEFTKKQIGKFSAPYISDLIIKSKVIGVGLGTSVMSLIEALPRQDLNDKKKKVVQIMGGLSNEITEGARSNELVKILNSKIVSEYFYLYCPALVADQKIRDALLKEPSIKNCIQYWDKVDLIIMGIGPANRLSTLVKSFPDEIITEIEQSEAVGELNINFIDLQGKYVPLLENHRIAMSFSNLTKVKNKVVIGFGEHKITPILAALRANMIDVLITDSITAQGIEKASTT